MTFIHIKKIRSDETGREVFAVPSVAIATPQGRMLIPNPAGTEASLFDSLPEAEEAIRRAGFDYVFEGRKTYTLNHPSSAEQIALAPGTRGSSDQAVTSLIRHLQDLEPSVVANSAFALGALRAYPALNALAEILGHDDPNVRKSVAEAMARLGASALSVLRDAYNGARTSNHKTAPYIRLTVMQAFLEMIVNGLGAGVIDSILPMAIQGLEDESWLVRAQAALVIGHAAQAQEQLAGDEVGGRERYRK